MLDLSVIGYEGLSELVTVVVEQVKRLSGTRLNVAFAQKYVEGNEEENEKRGGQKIKEANHKTASHSTMEDHQRKILPWPSSKRPPLQVPLSSKRANQEDTPLDTHHESQNWLSTLAPVAMTVMRGFHLKSHTRIAKLKDSSLFFILYTYT